MVKAFFSLGVQFQLLRVIDEGENGYVENVVMHFEYIFRRSCLLSQQILISKGKLTSLYISIFQVDNLTGTHFLKMEKKSGKKFKCDFCEKFYNRSGILKQHIKTIHEGQRNYKCNSCKKCFTLHGNLKRHIKAIHEDQNYKCDSCGKSFTESGTLKSHIKIVHEGQRNYKCNSCEKYFTLSGNLKTHIKTLHGGERNYKCNSCEKLFTQLGNLKRHITTVHIEQKITIVTLVVKSSLNHHL